MPLVNIVIVLIVVGILLWLINTYIPMDGKIKSILNAVVVIVLVVWLLQVFGLLNTLGGIRVGHVTPTYSKMVRHKGPNRALGHQA